MIRKTLLLLLFVFSPFLYGDEIVRPCLLITTILAKSPVAINANDRAALLAVVKDVDKLLSDLADATRTRVGKIKFEVTGRGSGNLKKRIDAIDEALDIIETTSFETPIDTRYWQQLLNQLRNGDSITVEEALILTRDLTLLFTKAITATVDGKIAEAPKSPDAIPLPPPPKDPKVSTEHLVRERLCAAYSYLDILRAFIQEMKMGEVDPTNPLTQDIMKATINIWIGFLNDFDAANSGALVTELENLAQGKLSETKRNSLAGRLKQRYEAVYDEYKKLWGKTY